MTVQGFKQLVRDWGVSIGIVLVLYSGWTLLMPQPLSEGIAPEFTLMDTSGEMISFPDEEKRLVFLNFWFSQCGPCRAEIPDLAGFYEAHPDVALWGVAVEPQMSIQQLARVSDSLGINYPVLHDKRTDVATAYRVGTYPTTIVVVDGEIKDVRIGQISERHLKRWLRKYSRSISS